MSGFPDNPENYQQVTYSLVSQGRNTELTLTEVNLPSEEAKATSEKSWDIALNMLKQTVEKLPVT